MDPKNMDYNDLVEVVRSLQNTLWPDGDLDAEWSSDTLEAVAGILNDAGLAPQKEQKCRGCNNNVSSENMWCTECEENENLYG